MIVNSLKLPVNWKGKTTIVLNIPQKCQNNKEMEAKNTQKKLKIAMKWAKAPFKTIISFANLSLWLYPSLIPEYTYQNTENMAKMPNSKKNPQKR